MRAFMGCVSSRSMHWVGIPGKQTNTLAGMNVHLWYRPSMSRVWKYQSTCACVRPTETVYLPAHIKPVKCACSFSILGRDTPAVVTADGGTAELQYQYTTLAVICLDNAGPAEDRHTQFDKPATIQALVSQTAVDNEWSCTVVRGVRLAPFASP